MKRFTCLISLACLLIIASMSVPQSTEAINYRANLRIEQITQQGGKGIAIVSVSPCRDNFLYGVFYYSYYILWGRDGYSYRLRDSSADCQSYRLEFGIPGTELWIAEGIDKLYLMVEVRDERRITAPILGLDITPLNYSWTQQP